MNINVIITTAKIGNPKDISKVLDFFRYKTATTLDCMIATGVLRNSITWYVAQLEQLGLLQVVFVKPDTHTGFKAKYYSADPSKWKKGTPKQLDLFSDVPATTKKEPQLVGDIIKNEWLPSFKQRTNEKGGAK